MGRVPRPPRAGAGAAGPHGKGAFYARDGEVLVEPQQHDAAAAAAWAAAHGNNQPQQPPERRGFWRPHAHVQQPPKNNYLAAGAPARPPQVEELHNKLKQFDEAGVMGAVYRGGACLFACGVLAFCSVAQPDRLTNAAYNLRYKETLGRILLCFAPSALLFLVVFSPKRATVGDAARAFHAAFFPAFIGCAACEVLVSSAVWYYVLERLERPRDCRLVARCPRLLPPRRRLHRPPPRRDARTRQEGCSGERTEGRWVVW